jgi:Ca-activated chloride channel family protein
MKNAQKITFLLVLFLALFACENQKKASQEKPIKPKSTVVVSDTQIKKTANKTEFKTKKVLSNKVAGVRIKNVNKEPVVQGMIEEDIEYEETEIVPFYKTAPDQIQPEHNTNEYKYTPENDYKSVSQSPLSTFSIDVDNASYSIVRQYLLAGNLPPKDAVRIEEMINYFDYNYKQATGEHPFSVYTELATAPWNENHLLAMIGINGKDLDYDDLKSSNLVFLLDTSGSMSARNKLPLLKKAFAVLIKNLPKNSKVAIVTYAGSAGLVLESTAVKHQEKILSALNNLESGGSTAGGAGIQLAYQVAQKSFIKNGNNRVILATDGDFNVGTSSSGALIRMIKEQKEKDIYLSILGFGMGNYKDGRMEEISNAGNGNYFYIDNYSEAKKVFEKDLLANMFTVAKDVKIQVEFNPNQVKAYRLIGYVNRKMANEDFNNDKKDAGELGPGHTVTALYEIIPASSNEVVAGIDVLKYQNIATTNSTETMTVKLRYKPIKSDVSTLISIPVNNTSKNWKNSSADFQFASSVAGFGLLLRDSKYKGNMSPNLARKLAYQSKAYNDSYKNEYITLIDKYESITKDTADTE